MQKILDFLCRKFFLERFQSCKDSRGEVEASAYKSFVLATAKLAMIWNQSLFQGLKRVQILKSSEQNSRRRVTSPRDKVRLGEGRVRTKNESFLFCVLNGCP
jgi:hypothetical protein